MLLLDFGNAKPRQTVYLPYPKKIAVVFQFAHVVICGPSLCGSPGSADEPRGRVIRISFDRSTHTLNDSYRFCEAVGAALPPIRTCLHR